MPDALPVAGADTDWREFRAMLARREGGAWRGDTASGSGDTSGSGSSRTLLKDDWAVSAGCGGGVLSG